MTSSAAHLDPFDTPRGISALDPSGELDLFGVTAAAPGPRLRMLPTTPTTATASTKATAAALAEERLHQWAKRLVQAVAEVVRGRRAVTQLIPWTDPAVYCAVHRQLRRLRLAFPGDDDQLRVATTHVLPIGTGSAEVTARLEHRGRSRALALRLEHREGRWLCVALDLI